MVSNKGATYEIQNLRTHRITRVHVSRLIPFDHDPTYTDPIAIAAKDAESFLVEEIIAHIGNPSAKSDMTFLVHWAGYDDPRDYTWEPWRSLNTNAILHLYLTNKGLHTLIPQGYREHRPRKTTEPIPMEEDTPAPPAPVAPANTANDGREKRQRRKRTWND